MSSAPGYSLEERSAEPSTASWQLTSSDVCVSNDPATSQQGPMQGGPSPVQGQAVRPIHVQEALTRWPDACCWLRQGEGHSCAILGSSVVHSAAAFLLTRLLLLSPQPVPLAREQAGKSAAAGMLCLVGGGSWRRTWLGC